MSSLNGLKEILQKYDPKGTFKNVAYHTTWNESLGFAKPDQPSDFPVGIPYSPWPKTEDDVKASKEKGFKGTIAAAFTDTIQHGIEASPNKGEVFIDIASLNGSWFYWWNTKHTNSGESHPAKDLCDKIAALDHDSCTPIVRILLGNSDNLNANSSWSGDMRNAYTNTFWPGSNALCNHPKAKLYVGFYSPNFVKEKLAEDAKVSAEVDALINIIRSMVDKVFVSGILDKLNTSVKEQHEHALNMLKRDELLNLIKNLAIPAISWNHGKVVAVNGKTLMTGGGNFWDSYSDNQHGISDFQCKIKGDAAVSAHSFCDHFWRFVITLSFRFNSKLTILYSYLNDVHPSDDHSYQYSTNFNNLDWSNKDPVPLFERESQSTSGIPVLSVVKIGSSENLGYPVLIIDAVRDIVLNILFRVFWEFGGRLALATVFRSIVMPSISDDSMLPDLLQAGVTPVAWASRIARREAITNAKHSVYIDAQIIAMYFQLDAKEFTKEGGPLDKINEKVGLKGLQKWDGIMWPYGKFSHGFANVEILLTQRPLDLLLALANFMNNLNPTPEDNVKKENGPGVRIILSSQNGGGGYEDQTAANELKQRVRWLTGTWTRSTAEFDKWFDARCEIRRISADGSLVNHCKVTCCDRALLYVGSDNPYPNYNQEHGVWIDNKEGIDAWYDSYWAPRWSQSKPADMSPNAGKRPATMDTLFGQ